MYSDGYLVFGRYSKSTDGTFIKYIEILFFFKVKLKQILFSIQISADEFCYLSGQCSAEMKKHVKYQVQAKLASDGEVLEARCECVAGNFLEANCKHVVVLLLAAESAANKQVVILEAACTERLQTFHHPKRKHSGSPIKAENMGRKHSTNNVQGMEKSDCGDDDKYQANKRFRNIILNCAHNSRMAFKQLFPPANPYAIEWDHQYGKETYQDRLLNSLKLQNISEAEIEKIENQTIGQHKSSIWQEERKKRISSSRFHSCCNFQSENAARNLAKSIIHPLKFSSRSTNHGIVHEATAVRKFMEPFCGALEAKETGLIIMKSHPFLAASPDRLLAEATVIEVKCPYTARFQKISPTTVSYLTEGDDGKLKLKKNHPYYSQVQGQMMVSGRGFCDFLVYTYKGLENIWVLRDEEFISEMLTKLCYFYENYFKPALFEEFFYRGYDQHNFCPRERF